MERAEVQKRYWNKNKDKINERRKKIEIKCPDCGEIRIVRADVKRLSNRCVKCNCLKIRVDKGDILHSLSKHPLYIRWAGMKQRVKDITKKTSYLDKGIIVCSEWDCNFMAFYEWSIINGFQPELELDRIDNDGHYCPENCRWISHIENCNNR